MLLRVVLVFVVVAGLAIAGQAAVAATFFDLRLTPDGSADPPGDVLELEALFYPDDPPLTVEVHAFRVVEGPPAAGESVAQRIPEPIAGASETSRDEQGHFRQRVTVEPPAEGRMATVRIVVPYSELTLPIGEHSIAYDLTAFRGETVEFNAATEVTFMTLTEEPRTEMKVPAPRQTSSTRQENRTIKIADPTQPLGFREQQVQVTLEDVSTEEVFETATVNIPHGYLRRRRNQYMAHVPGGSDPLQAQLNSLQDGGKPWSWRKQEPILFATNRSIQRPQARDLSRFGASVGNRITYGSCLVTFPLEKHHQQGRIEQPRWWERCDPNKHFSVDAVNVLNPADVRAMLQNAFRDSHQDVLLMVHGFNNPFDFAILRLAQLKLDIHFPGPAMLFSWPSQGTAQGYPADEEAAKSSVAALKEVLKTLATQRQESGGTDRKIHLLAHSMGNRVLLGALGQLAAEGFAGSDKPFGQVILAAPDVDFVMMNRLQGGLNCAEHVTLYYCEDDIPLGTSRYVNSDSRIGQFGYIFQSLENVDAKHASTSLLGHDYFSASSRLLVDLELLINLRLPAVSRPQTVRSRNDSVGNQEWFFPAMTR
jgi:esterase/lipase superfamily enzyme